MLSQPASFAAPLPADLLLPSPSSSVPAINAGCPISRSFFARCGIPQISTLELRSGVRGVPHLAHRRRMKLATRKYFMRQFIILIAFFSLLDTMAFATIFGSVRGVVHDPQHRPVRSVQLTLKAQNSGWTQSQETNDNGEFVFTSVPVGDYTVTATLNGFQEATQDVIVQSDTSPVLHFQLAVAGVKESVVVPETVGAATTDSV